jgi:dTDP-4-amino-4,6-dideoxygalactose transaminase
MIQCANPLAQFESHREEIEAAVLRVMRGNRYILGPEVQALEHEFAEYIGVRKAIGVANGTDALELALRALDIGPGDEVITVSQTAVATIAAIESTGASVVVVDVDPVFYTLDAAQLEAVRTSKTRAVIAVHLYGQPADLDAIGQFCNANGIALIEDVAQAHGARWKGKRLGSIGRIGCFSCYPTKNLGALGDAGLVTTDDEQLAEKVRMLRQYGWSQRYISDIAGRNSRLDELQAAVLRIKLRYLDADNDRRRALAAEYSKRLAGTMVTTPQISPNAEHAFHLYVIRSDDRRQLIAALEAGDVHPGIHYPVPVHLQPAYRGRIRTSASMQVTESLANEGLSLPMYPELEMEQVRLVCLLLVGAATPS